jgi:hypothetical protein
MLRLESSGAVVVSAASSSANDRRHAQFARMIGANGRDDLSGKARRKNGFGNYNYV